MEELPNADGLLKKIQENIVTVLGNDYEPPRKDTYFYGLAYTIRDILIRRWIESQRSFYRSDVKRVYYLSMEFLPGRFLKNYVSSLGMENLCRDALDKIYLELEEIAGTEEDAGLGNGGLGRLASCFMDSMATLGIPGYGYGLRYDYGIFHQQIVDGEQHEVADNWNRFGNPWEITRRGYMNETRFYGRNEMYRDEKKELRYRWVDAEEIGALACDILIPGYGTGFVNNMRLFTALSSSGFDLEYFQQGNYLAAMEKKILSENISKVLYPRDESVEGKELRLKQQYFFVAATFEDIMRRFRKSGRPYTDLSSLVAVQLNDTHPVIAIPELMRLLIDQHQLDWTMAWDAARKVFSYTNHTVLPEALEVWPADLLGKLLPRHLEIIREINRRFLKELAERYPGDKDLPARVAIIENSHGVEKIHMARLGIVGSHRVNGVAALHTRILQEHIFSDFHKMYPDRIINITNGITPRRWLLQCNPALSKLVSTEVRGHWVTELSLLEQLNVLAEDDDFQQKWRQVKLENKERLASCLQKEAAISIDTASMFDIQVKRIHEYKRQLLNILHVIYLYKTMLDNPGLNRQPRTVFFGGKAAPGYFIAKLIIRLINAVAWRVNNEPRLKDRLKVVFVPNYNVTRAEYLVPAADLSEQISTAGLEASGTGNMKFALNGALTIGTLDGANIEIMEEVGRENIFIFGLTAEEIQQKRAAGYQPRDLYKSNADIKAVLDLLSSDWFSPDQPGLFQPLVDNLLKHGDNYFVLADFAAYRDCQLKVEETYALQSDWTAMSIRNTANMGKFSSDRAIKEYAEKVWGIDLKS